MSRQVPAVVAVEPCTERVEQVARHLDDDDLVRAVHVLLRAAPFLVSDHDHASAMVAGDARDDGCVVREAPIAMELEEILEEVRDVVERVGPVRMP